MARLSELMKNSAVPGTIGSSEPVGQGQTLSQMMGYSKRQTDAIGQLNQYREARRDKYIRDFVTNAMAEKRRKEEARRRLPDDNSLAYQMMKDRTASHLNNQPSEENRGGSFGSGRAGVVGNRENNMRALQEQYWQLASAPDNPLAAAIYHATNGYKPNRGSNVLKGSGMDYEGSMISAIGTAAQSVGNVPAQQNEPKSFLDQWAAAVSGMHDNPAVFGINQIRSSKETADAAMELGQTLRDYGAERSKSGQELVQAQKEGLGTVGKTMVDVGSGGIQMALDIGIGALTGLGMAAPMAVRVFGSSVEEAAENGATLNQQLAYGLGSAALSYGLEHISNVALSGLKVVAPGIGDDVAEMVIDKLAQKLAKTPKGATALKVVGSMLVSAGGEGFEESMESFLQPYLKNLTYDENAKSAIEDPSQWADILYDGLLGAILGVTGYGVNTAVNTGGSSGASEDIRSTYERYQGIFTDEAVNKAYDAIKENGMFSREGREAISDARRKVDRFLPQKTAVNAPERVSVPGNIQTRVQGEKSDAEQEAAKAAAILNKDTPEARQQRGIEAALRAIRQNEAEKRAAEEAKKEALTPAQKAAFDGMFGRSKKPASEVDTGKKAPGFYANNMFAGSAEDQKYLDNLAKAAGVNIEMTRQNNGSNGWIVNGEVYISERAEDPARIVAKHEVSHRLQYAAPEAYAKYRGFVENIYRERETLDQQIEAIRELYAQNGHQLTQEQALDELAADFSGELMENETLIRRLAGEDRNLAQRILDAIRDVLRRIKSALSDAETRRLDRAARLWESALKETNRAYERGEADAVGVSYQAIGKTTDNKPFVEIEDDILANVQKKNWVTEVKKELNKKFPNEIIVGNSKIRIDYQSRKELTFSKYMQWLRKHDEQIYSDKLRATNNANEILEATEGWINEGLNHPRQDNIVDFARGSVLLRVGGNDYTAEVVVGTRKNEQMLLYDVLNLQPTSFVEKETDAAKAENPSPETNRSTASVSEDTVPQAKQSVKGSRELQRKIDALERQNKRLKDQLKRTDVPKVRREVVKRSAKELRSMYNSRIDADELTTRIEGLYNKIAKYSGAGSLQEVKGIPSWQEIQSDANGIARDIVAESRANVNTKAEEYSELRREMKGRKISIADRYRSDLESAGGYEGIRKRNFGSFTLSKDGTPIDVVYMELSEKHPELFPDDIYHPADQLVRLSDIMEDLKPIEGNPFEQDLDHTAEYLAGEIIERFYDTPNESPTEADKMADAFHRQRLRDQKELKARLEKQKKAYETQAEELRKRFEQENEERIERQNATQRRQTIFRHAFRLANKLERPTNKQHIPEKLRGAALNLLKYINLQSGFEYEFTKGAEYRRVEPGTVLGAEKTGRTLAALELREQLEQIAKNETLTIDPEMNDYLQEIARMGDKTLVEMSKTELDTVWKVMQIIEHTISKANELHEMGRYKTVSAMADAIEESAGGREDRKSFIGPVGALDKLVNFDMLAPETFLHKLGAAGDELFKMMRRSEDRQTAIIKDGVEKAEKLVKESGVDFSKLEKELHTFNLGGKQLTLSTSHIMELYALMKRKQAVDHILKGGLKNVGVVKGAEELRNSQPVRVTLSDVGEIISKLTDEQKKLMDGLQEYMSTTLAERGNEETMKVYGYKKFKEKNYWPIKVAGSEVKSDPTSKMREKMIPAYGMTKLTQPKAKNPVELHSAIDSFTNHLNQMATYAAWLGTNEDITRLVNFKYTDENLEERDNVKRILESVYGKNGEAYLDNLLGDIAQGTKTGRDTALTDVLNANWKAAKVGGNLRVIVQQPTSIFRALDTLDAKHLLSGGNVKKGWEKAKKYSGIAQWKDWGYFEINTGRSLRELIVGTERGVDKVKNALMWAAGAADSATWGYLWNAVEAETADNYPGLQKGTDEFYRTVAERFDEIIDRTQVVDSVLHRTQIMRSGNALNKMASNFMSEPSKIYNMVSRNIIDLTNAKTDEERRAAIKGSARTFGALTASFAVNALAQSLIDALRDDDRDDEYWEKFAKNYFGITGEEETATEVWKSFWDGNFWQNFNPFGYVPYVKDVMSLIEGYSVDRSDMAAVTELINAMRQFAKSIGGEGKKTVLATGMEAAAKVCDLLGIPVSNIKRDVAAAINTALNEFDLYDLQYELDKIVYSEENAASVFYGDIYRAMNGDVDAYTEIYEDFYQGLIENGASEEDAQEKIKSAMEDKMKDEIGVKSVKSLPVRWEPPTADDSADERARKFLQLLFAGEKKGGWTSQFSEEQLELSREVDAVRDETNLKKAMTVANGDWAEWIKENQLKNIMDDAAYARYTAARSAGVSTKEFVDMLQRADEIAKARGAKNASQADIKQALSESRLSTKKKRAIWNGYVETGVWKTKSPW